MVTLINLLLINSPPKSLKNSKLRSLYNKVHHPSSSVFMTYKTPSGTKKHPKSTKPESC